MQVKEKIAEFFTSFLDVFGGRSGFRAQQARLEAFLAAVPGEYCGWASDGTIAYSQGFCGMLGLERINGLHDIQNRLKPQDSAALEGYFARMRESGASFTLNARDRGDAKTFRISGLHGRDVSGQDFFNILWLEDITHQEEIGRVYTEERAFHRHEIDRLQDSLDALPMPVWIRDEHQKITWCNIAYAKKIDARPSEIIAQQKEIVSSARKRKPGEKDLLLGPDLARVVLEKGVAQEIRTHVVICGNRLLMRIIETPLKSRGITVGIAEDLTEEEQLETEMKNRQTATRALLEQLHSAIGIYEPDQRLAFYNSAFAALWGLEDGWLNTKPKMGDIMEKLRETRRLPEQADFRAFKKSWLDMFTGLIDPYEDMLYLPDGSALRMLVVPHMLGGLMMTFEDVTSRLELESSYNTLVAVQKETLDNLAESVAVYGGDGRLRLCNPAFARLWGLNPEDVDGEPHITRIVEKMKPFFTEEDWARRRDMLIALGLERVMHEGRLERFDDTLVDFATVPLPDGGVLITFTDVTDTVRVEKALRDKNVALEAAEQLKIDFLANVSYQLRTPLNAIMGFNEILDQQFFGSLNAKQQEYTRDIRDASERLLGLINDILDLSSIEAGHMILEREKVSVHNMMENVVALVGDWARKENIRLDMSCPKTVGEADIDERRVKQAVMNVLRNAISHTPEGGKIDIKVRKLKDENMIEVAISDTGEGIDIIDQARIMQPFERVEGVQASARGAGLGLPLVQNIVALHGGQFALKSEKGKGTTVVMRFPIRYEKAK